MELNGTNWEIKEYKKKAVELKLFCRVRHLFLGSEALVCFRLFPLSVIEQYFFFLFLCGCPESLPKSHGRGWVRWGSRVAQDRFSFSSDLKKPRKKKEMFFLSGAAIALFFGKQKKTLNRWTFWRETRLSNIVQIMAQIISKVFLVFQKLKHSNHVRKRQNSRSTWKCAVAFQNRSSGRKVRST